MKVFYNTFPANPRPEFDFNKNHMVGSLEKYFQPSSMEDCTHHLILDVGEHIDRQIEQISNYRNQGKKIILMVFDPPAFKRVDNFICHNMLDKIILFDSQFRDRFPIKTFVSDYFVNPDLFQKKTVQSNNEVCVYGTLNSVGRNNEYNLKRVDSLVTNYIDFFKLIQNYNGVCVYDTGWNESFTGLAHYNHCKPIEALMCGVNVYCQDGIKTKRYDRFLKKFDRIPTPEPVEFDQEEIWKINELTIRELVYECVYID